MLQAITIIIIIIFITIIYIISYHRSPPHVTAPLISSRFISTLLPTKALRRGKAPLSHESQPFRHSFLSALAECPDTMWDGGVGGG